MFFSNDGFLYRHKIADSQTERLKALYYNTHMKLLCQPLRKAASYIIVLSIIPLR